MAEGELVSIDFSCRCPSPTHVTCQPVWEIWIDSATGIVQTSIERCCIGCGTVIAPRHLSGTVEPRAVDLLRGREAVGRSGDADSLGLVAWTELGRTIAPNLLIQTVRAERIEQTLSLIPREQLHGMLRNALQLNKNMFPRLVTTVPRTLPRMILHEGLVVKLALPPPDSNHFRLARKTEQTVSQPLEVWRDLDHKGKPVIRFLSRYGAPVGGRPGILNHIVVMEAATGIALTSYIRRDAQIVADRRGTLLHAAWAAPSA